MLLGFIVGVGSLLCILCFYTFFNKKNKVLFNQIETLNSKLINCQENYNTIYRQMEGKNNLLMQLSGEKASLQASLNFAQEKDRTIANLENERKLLNVKIETLNRTVIQMQEKISSTEKLEADLKLLLENAKQEITIQNRVQYQAIHDKLQKYTEEKGKEINKEAAEIFDKILEKDVKIFLKSLQENLNLQQEKLMSFQKPVDFFTKILAGSKEAGTHGEQTIVNQLEAMGLKFGIDYLVQVSGKSGEERLIADIVILVPNSGKKDVLIIDSKSSTKLGSSTAEFMQSIEASVNTFAKKDYKTAVEKGLKEHFPEILINQTHLFIYLPFDRMLSRISEEKPEFLRKTREKEIGILTPVILDFLLDSIKLYSAKVEMNEKAESMMLDVKQLIERTAKVLEFIKDLGKSVDQTARKYSVLKGSVSRMFVPAVNRMAKPLNIKAIAFDDLNEEDLKEIKNVD